jgi:hypothetical protein
VELLSRFEGESCDEVNKSSSPSSTAQVGQCLLISDDPEDPSSIMLMAIVSGSDAQTMLPENYLVAYTPVQYEGEVVSFDLEFTGLELNNCAESVDEETGDISYSKYFCDNGTICSKLRAMLLFLLNI